jgi:hypothetical protein
LIYVQDQKSNLRSRNSIEIDFGQQPPTVAYRWNRNYQYVLPLSFPIRQPGQNHDRVMSLMDLPTRYQYRPQAAPGSNGGLAAASSTVQIKIPQASAETKTDAATTTTTGPSSNLNTEAFTSATISPTNYPLVPYGERRTVAGVSSTSAATTTSASPRINYPLIPYEEKRPNISGNATSGAATEINHPLVPYQERKPAFVTSKSLSVMALKAEVNSIQESYKKQGAPLFTSLSNQAMQNDAFTILDYFMKTAAPESTALKFAGNFFSFFWHVPLQICIARDTDKTNRVLMCVFFFRFQNNARQIEKFC